MLSRRVREPVTNILPQSRRVRDTYAPSLSRRAKGIIAPMAPNLLPFGAGALTREALCAAASAVHHHDFVRSRFRDWRWRSAWCMLGQSTAMEALMSNPYTMSIETHEFESHQYGFHLGTDENIARELIEERFIGRINAKLPVVTIALMLDGHIVDVYSGRWAND